MRFFLIILAAVFWLVSPVARAETWQQALSMHDKPALPDNFSHFPYVNAAAPKGGVLRLGVVGSFDSLNPFIIRGRVPALLANTGYIFEPLMARSADEPFTLYPLLAEAVRVADNRAAIEFRINPKAQWADGKAVSTDDVLFSWRTLKAEGRPNMRSFYSRVAKVSVPATGVVRFDFLPEADGSFNRELPLILALMPILPQHFWQGRVFNETTLQPLMGSGPYEITTIDAGRKVVLTRRTNYWAQDLPTRRGLYNFDTISIDFFRDEQVALTAFLAGQYDLRRESDAVLWQTGYAGTAQKQGNFKLAELPHQRPEPYLAVVFNTRNAPFNNDKVRQALGLALDFEWLNKALFANAYRRAPSSFANSALAQTGLPQGRERELLQAQAAHMPPEILADIFTKPIHLPSTDGSGPVGLRDNLRKAMALLQEAGYRVKDGVLVNAQNQPLQFELLLVEPSFERIGLEYARALKRLGIELRVRTVDSAQYQERLNNFDYDLIVNRWFNSLSPGTEQGQYWGSSAAHTKGSRNYSGIANAALDALIAYLPRTESRAELTATAKAIDRLVMRSGTSLPLYYLGRDLVAHSVKIAMPDNLPITGFVQEALWQAP